MLEIKVTVAAPELVAAISTLASAIAGTTPQQVSQPSAPQPTASAGLVPTTPPVGAYVNGAATNVQCTGATQAPAQTLTPPATQTVPAAYPSPVTVAAQSAQQASPFNQPPVAPAGPTANVPLAQPPQYTIDQIMAAGTSLMDAGKTNDLVNLLHSFGVQAVTELKPENYGAFATALRGMGAKI